VTAGLDAVARVGQLVSPKGGEPLQAQVVVATGLALVSQRQAVGEPSIIAAGMCDLAAPNSVLVTASTRRLISSAFICENPEQHALAGVSDPVSTWRVTGKRAVASRFKAKRSKRGYPTLAPGNATVNRQGRERIARASQPTRTPRALGSRAASDGRAFWKLAKSPILGPMGPSHRVKGADDGSGGST
jgi:hypothetical protein